MNQSQLSSPDAQLLHLVEAYCNGNATDEEFAQLEQRLLGDPTARGFYLRYLNLDSALQQFGDSDAGVWQAESSTEASVSPPTLLAKRGISLAIAASLIAVAAGLAIAFWLIGSNEDNTPQAIAVIQQVRGEVAIISSGGDSRTVNDGSQLWSGETLRIVEPLSAANVIFADGTRLSFFGKSSATCSQADRKGIVLHGGTMFANVSPQPSGRPLQIATPTDQLEVLGTRFTIDATAAETDMSVAEGRVRLTRFRDGKSVEVPAGRRVVSNATSALALVDIPETPDGWSEDFENGVPDQWGRGKLVAADLPAASQGAVRAVKVATDDAQDFQILTQEAWTHGLFTVHDDTHLHVTLKMQDPGWINILLLTKTTAGDPPSFAGNYIFDRPVWTGQPGEWGTLTIPLSKFRALPSSPGDIESVIPFQVLFSSPDMDRELVIDRMWVDRNGTGEVEVETLP